MLFDYKMNLKFMEIGAKSLCDINFICISVVFLLSFVSLQLKFLRVWLEKVKSIFLPKRMACHH